MKKLGGCDYCVIDFPTSWSDAEDQDDVRRGWAGCLSREASLDETNQTVRASYCHLPSDSGGVAAGGVGRLGWGVWGLVLLVGFGCVEGVLV